MKLADAMHDADFVLIDGEIFETEYLRVPDEHTVVDDVVLEAKRGDDEIAFTRGDVDDVVLEAKRGEDEVALTRGDVDDAIALGDGIYRLKSGALLRFLVSATIH